MAIAARLSSKRAARLRDNTTKWMFLIPAMLFIALFFGYPVIQNFVMGFQQYTTKTFFTGEAPFVGFDNYAAVFQKTVFARAAINTLLFTLGSIAFQFIVGLGLAVFFKRRFPLNGILRSLLLLPWLLPLVVSSTVWRSILDTDNGILNQMIKSVGLAPVPWLTSPDIALMAIILVNVWIGIPFNVVLLYSGLQDVPTELYEAAALDGATGWKAFRFVTWPLLRPVINVVLLLGVVYTIKAVDIILTLTGGGPADATQTIATQSYESSFREFNFGEGAAFGNILIVVSVIFSLIYLRANRRSMQS